MKGRFTTPTPAPKPVKKTHLPYREWAQWHNGRAERTAQFRADTASGLEARRAGRTLTLAEYEALARHEA